MLRSLLDDTKVYSKISTVEDSRKLQCSLNACAAWSDTWLLQFNSSKCKVLHLGRNNPNYDYFMSDGSKLNKLDVTTCEKDLGVYIDNDLNFKEHVINQTNKARSIAGCIHRNIINKTPDIMVPLFIAMIRPTVEYGNTVWVPYYKKDKKELKIFKDTILKESMGWQRKVIVKECRS